MFVLAWLNLTTQPCLMAMESAADTPLASAHAVHPEHAEHMGGANAADDCGHCPPGIESEEILCATGSASDCGLFPGYNIDGRQFKLQPKDVFLPLALSTIECSLDFSAPVTLFPPHDTKRLKFAGDPTLNIRHCVFLK